MAEPVGSKGAGGGGAGGPLGGGAVRLEVPVTESSPAIAYLESFIDYERSTRYTYSVRTFNLERVRLLLGRLGDPHLAFPSIHVAGTNGKGTITAACASVLRAAGYRVGMYTSPHLVSFRERVRVDGLPISADELEERVERLRRAIPADRSAPDHGTYSFFEVYTALAFLHFALSGVDVASVEVGLGGRLDATNVVRTAVSVIGPIGIDHAAKLGQDVATIAAEKAAIIREGGIVVTSPQEPEADDVIAKFARDRGANLTRVGGSAPADFVFDEARTSLAGCSFDLSWRDGGLDGLSAPLAGLYQPSNCATAAAACICARRAGLTIPDEAVRTGLARTRWPGRLQVLPGTPDVILDCAHNPSGAAALVGSLRALLPAGGSITVVFGASRDKDVRGVLGVLAPLVARLVACRVDVPRAVEPEDISALAVEAGVPLSSISTAPTVAAALETALSDPGDGSVVLVTGSIYVVGAALAELAKRPPYAAPVVESLPIAAELWRT